MENQAQREALKRYKSSSEGKECQQEAVASHQVSDKGKEASHKAQVT